MNDGDNDYVDERDNIDDNDEDLKACATLIPWLSVSREMNAMNLSFQTAFLITPIKASIVMFSHDNDMVQSHTGMVNGMQHVVLLGTCYE